MEGRMLFITTLLILFLLPTSSQESECGYDSCPAVSQEEGVINVHLVAHSHDDVGWLKTVDQYYEGSNRAREGPVGVQYTIDTVVQELSMDPDRKFIQVETAFFWRWWREQDDITKDIVRQLVNQGQLEFIGGGWSNNDEGASHYAAVIDQMSLGLRILNDTFGECGVPKVAWQIDSFGHSKEQATLFARMGMDGLFFARLDWRDKSNRADKKEMEMVWEASQDLGEKADLFTGVLHDHYGPPPGFCWDLLCNDDPIMDGDHLDSANNNVANITRDFVAHVRNQANHYRTNNIMLTMGMDFNYQAAHSWYMNLDKLIKIINGLPDEKLNLFYSTPSCYLKAVHSAGEVWPTKQDDFFPYATDPHAYWTGYFSSRPTSKYMMRQTERMWKVLSQMASTWVREGDEQMGQLSVLQETVGIIQHHDAITGTEKQHVADNYHSRMHRALTVAAESVGLTPVYTDQSSSTPSLSGSFCPLLNITQCPPTETFTEPLTVSIYNQLARVRSPLVRLPVTPGDYVVTGMNGEVEESQLVPLAPHILKLPGRESQATQELLFRATDVPALCSKEYLVKRINTETQVGLVRQRPGKYSIGSGQQKLLLKDNSSIILVRDEVMGLEQEVNIELLYYKGHRGNNSEFEFRASGAYIFRPDGLISESFGNPTESLVTTGSLVDEVHWVYSSDWVFLTIRLIHLTGELEVDWSVGPIPVDDGVGKEVIARYSTNIDSKGMFLTDSGGRQLLMRERDVRPTFEINGTEPVSENYYPVVSSIGIRDPSITMTVLTDRSQGGSSLQDGAVELMVHRRLLDDDAFGLGEALNETSYGVGLVAVGKHTILLDNNPEESAKQHRLGALDMFHTPLITFNPKKTAAPASALSQPLPSNLHLLSLQAIKRQEEGDFLLLQLEHIFQEGEHSLLSEPVILNLSDLFNPDLLLLEWARETWLGGNKWLEESDRMYFIKESNAIPKLPDGNGVYENDLEITIKPMEIRTFIVKVVYANDPMLNNVSQLFHPIIVIVCLIFYLI